MSWKKALLIKKGVFQSFRWHFKSVTWLFFEWFWEVFYPRGHKTDGKYYVRVTNCNHSLMVLLHFFCTGVHFWGEFHYSDHVGYQKIKLDQSNLLNTWSQSGALAISKVPIFRFSAWRVSFKTLTHFTPVVSFYTPFKYKRN